MSEKDLLEKVAPFSKEAYIPITKDIDGGITSSKFSGIPWLSQNETWPACPNCHNPLAFFLQLNLNELPALPQGCGSEGLIQLFYCINQDKHCESECEAFSPFSKSVIARFVNISNEQPQKHQTSPANNAFPPKIIIGWEKQADYPTDEELTDQLELSEEEEELYYDLELTLPGDKLLGWPAWVQGAEYPDCPECGETMHLLFQLDSENNLPYMFGDVGCGHITICPKHQHQLAFGWACS